LREWCKNKGIVIEFTAPYSPQSNGTAERINRTIMEKAKALIFDSGLSKRMWGEAVLTSASL
jgi:transposase InsO family protein